MSYTGKFYLGDRVTAIFSRKFGRVGTVIDINETSSYPIIIEWAETVGAAAEEDVFLVERVCDAVQMWLTR